MSSSNIKVDIDVEIRECRCMFCGVLLLLKSETEAIAHMGICMYFFFKQ